MNADFYASQIANYAKQNELDCPLAHLHVILYILQLHSYKFHQQPCFDDDFRAYQYAGPAIEHVYLRHADRGMLNIRYPAAPVVLAPEQLELVHKCLNIDAFSLREHITRPGSAWDKTRRAKPGYAAVILKNLIAQDALSL